MDHLELEPFPEEQLQRALEAESRLIEQIRGYEEDITKLTREVCGNTTPGENTIESLEDLQSYLDNLITTKTEINEAKVIEAYLEVLIQMKAIEAKTETQEEISLLESLEAISKLSTDIDAQDILKDHKVHLQNNLKLLRSGAQTNLAKLFRRQLTQALSDADWPNAAIPDKKLERLRQVTLDSLSMYRDVELPGVLNVFEVMVVPLHARFSYHFNSKRQTNRLDKPEWFFQHTTAIAERHNPFIVDFMQPILSTCFQNRNMVASHEFIRALLPMVLEKTVKTSEQVMDDTDLLTHLISEAKQFDDTLREDFGYRNRDMSHWTGTAAALLSDDVFDTWLEAEDSFAKERYHAIVDEFEAFEIQEDADLTLCEIAANTASLKLVDQFEAMTRQFAPVENLDQRAKFVSTIQRTLLDSFLEKIRESTDAFEQLTGGFSGGFPSPDIAGLGGLQRLCRQLSGVANIHDRLRQWCNETFYIELESTDGPDTCFAQQLKEYESLRARIEQMIIHHIEADLTQELRPYSKLHTWHSDQAPLAQVASVNPSSPQLIKVYESINLFFSYLSRVAATSLIHRLYRSIAKGLDHFLWLSIIRKNEFSRRGALQLLRDVLEVWATFSPFVSKPEQGMRRVSDALLLLKTRGKQADREVLQAIMNARSDSELRPAGIQILNRGEVEAILAGRLFEIAIDETE